MGKYFSNICTVLGLIAVTFAAAGCLEGIEEWSQDFFGTEKLQEELNFELETTIAEIDAVGSLKSDSAKLEGFKAIAGRERLLREAQAYMVRPVAKKVFSSSAKEEILITLINNPNFCLEAKKEILFNLNKLAEENKINVLRAINNRGALKK
jgi:hypothetical protein